MKTRYAEKEDLAEVYVMYLAGLEERKDNVFPVNETKALDYVLLCWSKAPCILLLDDEQIVGFAGLNLCSVPHSDVLILRDYMFYTKPSHRGFNSWRALCKAVSSVADKFNLTFVGEHLLTDTIPKHERLIRAAGAKPVSIMSVYEPKND